MKIKNRTTSFNVLLRKQATRGLKTDCFKKIIKQFRRYFVVYFGQESTTYIVHKRDDHKSPTSNICRVLKGESISSVRV